MRTIEIPFGSQGLVIEATVELDESDSSTGYAGGVSICWNLERELITGGRTHVQVDDHFVMPIRMAVLGHPDVVEALKEAKLIAGMTPSQRRVYAEVT